MNAEKLGSGGLGLSDGEIIVPWELRVIYYIQLNREGGSVITCRSTRRQGYYMQLKKEESLANLCRSSLISVGELSPGHNAQEENAVLDINVHIVSISTQTQARLCCPS